MQPIQSQTEEIPASETISDGYIETFIDGSGNTTKDEIIYNQLFDVKESESEEIVYIESDVEEIYNVNDFITVESGEISLYNTTLPRPYAFIASKCNWTLNQCGTLYGKSKVDQIKKFMFDFKKDAAISVVAAAITMVWGAPIVAVGVLLASLGVGVVNPLLTASLNGYYDSTRTQYSYYVVVKQKETFKHNQEKYVVYYYNTTNGKQSTRTSQSASWISEDAVLDIGIVSY